VASRYERGGERAVSQRAAQVREKRPVRAVSLRIAVNSAEEALIFLLQEESVRQPRFSEPESVTYEMLRTHILFQF